MASAGMCCPMTRSPSLISSIQMSFTDTWSSGRKYFEPEGKSVLYWNSWPSMVSMKFIVSAEDFHPLSSTTALMALRLSQVDHW